MHRVAATLTLVMTLIGCASSSQVIVGTLRPAINADQVKVYPVPPARFDEIAILDASSKSVFGTGGQKTTDKLIDQLKVQAAKLGANGLIIEGFAERQTASIGTGVGSESYSRSSAVAVGASGSFGVFKKTGKARAIFVPPN